MPTTLVECVPNFSEGRDKAKVDAIVDAMKMTSLSCGQGRERHGVLELPWRCGAAFLGQRRAGDPAIADRTIEFALESNSLWRIAGSVFRRA